MMAARFLSLEEAAAQLGITPEELKQLRDAGDIHGYRDGASWKFKPEEVERLAQEMKEGEGLLPDDHGLDDLLSLDDLSLEDDTPKPAADAEPAARTDASDDDDISVLVDESPPQKEKSSTVIGEDEAGDEESDLQLAPVEEDEPEPIEAVVDSGELKLADEEPKAGTSDPVALVDSGEEVAQAAPTGSSDSDDFELSDDDLLFDADDARLGEAAKDLALSDDDDLLLGGSGSSEDDFELSPGDSGISLASSDIDAVSLEESSAGASSSESDDFELDLGEDSAVVPGGVSDSSSEVLQPDEEFLLTPAEDSLAEDSSDSGSQVIALDDSETGSADLTPVLEPAADSAEGAVAGVAPALQPIATAAPAIPTETLPEAEYSVMMMIWLGVLSFTLLALGMLLFDIVRNMWSWQGQFAHTSWLTDALVSALQLDRP